MADRPMTLKGDRGAAKKLSNTCVLKNLQQELKDKQQAYKNLEEENTLLRTREEVLLKQVTQQGDNLHFVALAAAQTQSTTSNSMPDLAKSLLQDMEVHVMMGMLGRPDSSSKDVPLTTQWLRAAVTPERVAAVHSMTLEQVAATLKQLTMRMCMLLVSGLNKAHLFNESLEVVMNEYGEFGLLLHVAADWLNLQIGTLNLDTLQVQEPPPGYWEKVADSLELDEQQIQTLTMGFHTYQQKARPIIAALHTTVNSIRGILEASECSDSIQSQAVDSTADRGQQPVQQRGQDHVGMSNDSGDALRPWCASKGMCGDLLLLHQQVTEDGKPLQPLGQQWQQQQQQPHQQHTTCGEQQDGQQVDQGMPQQQHHNLLQEVLQQGASMAAWDDAACSHMGGMSPPKPWQQFGLSHGCLTIETAEVLEGHMTELMQHVMKLREMHRTVTWLFLNVLTHRQHVLSITGSWPWWSRTLTMCQYITEKHEQQHKPKQTRPNRHAPVPVRYDSGTHAGPGAAAAAAAAVADDVWRAQARSAALTGPAQLRGSTLTPEGCDVWTGTA